VWALASGAGGLQWREVQTAGEAPPPKVWYGAVATSQGNWVISGGSQWQFEESGLSDQGVVWVLELSSFSWSSMRPPQGSPLPDVLVACSIVEVDQGILVLGGCMPHKLGVVPAGQNAFRQCLKWYVPLTRPWRCDLQTGQWAQEAASARPGDVPEPGDT
ncbi:unnamed protein product, partial [Polarella glacialis]